VMREGPTLVRGIQAVARLPHLLIAA
jgi:hypothetical protein